MSDITEKHAKRIRDLIHAKWAATLLLFGGCLFPPLSPVPLALGLLYGLEARRFLRLYPTMEEEQANELRSAKARYFLMFYVHLTLWLVFGVILAIELTT